MTVGGDRGSQPSAIPEGPRHHAGVFTAESPVFLRGNRSKALLTARLGRAGACWHVQC